MVCPRNSSAFDWKFVALVKLVFLLKELENALKKFVEELEVQTKASTEPLQEILGKRCNLQSNSVCDLT